MKKVSLLLAMIAFVCGNAFAQLSYDFNNCPAGAKIAQTLGEPWSTWSEAPGGEEDGVFAEQGSMACYFTYGNDQILKLNGLTSGTYSIGFDMYIPDGKDAYNNILHIFNGTGSQWATEVFYKTTDNGTSIMAGGVTTNFDCPFDEWFNVKYLINLDSDHAFFYVNGEEITDWTFSLQAEGQAGERKIDALDFFPPTSSAKSMYYIDNLEVTPVVEEEVLIFEPFEEYTVGNQIAMESVAAGHDWWTTWSNNPGSAEDGVVSEYNSTKCGHLTYGNDQVLLLGDEENGVYDLEFDILVPDGKNGYFNILHHFAGTNSIWALECYLHMALSDNNSVHSPGTSVLRVAGSTVNGPSVVYDAWMHFRLHVDTDTDVAEYYYTAPGAEEVLIHSWQWSLDSQGTPYGRKMAAMDFFPPQDAAHSEYYLDNFSFKKIGGESAPEMVVTPAEVNEGLEVNDMAMVDITINNDGNSMGDWSGWVDFGQGTDGTAGSDLMYHDGTLATGIGHSEEHTREIGIRLTPQMYAGAAMGKKLVSAQFQTGSQDAAADGNYTFRLYGQGINDQPGELLAEKTVNSTALGTWITATFDEAVYLTGQEVWVTVTMLQAANQYPLSMDDSHLGQVQNGNWLATDGGSFSHCYSEGNFEGAWMITAHCEGNAIPGGWASLSKTNGSILGGQSEVVTLALNSIGLTVGEVYEANIIINTNDAENPHFEIPIILAVSGVSVEETSNALASIYPNPASTSVTLEGENLSTVAIYNVAGQLVRIVKLDGAVNTIDMNVEAGVYFFSIYDNAGNNMVQRVVITK